MNLFMHKNLKIVLPLLAAAMIAVACDDDNNGVPGEPILPPGESDGGGYEEVEPERPEYVNANLVYYGNDGVSESSDGWVLTLYTDMTVETGYPVGPGQILSITINATPSPTGKPSIEYLAGDYHMPLNSGDFSAGTYIQGEMYTIEMPGETIERPDGTFFADIPAGETKFDADLLREGTFSIADNGDGTFTVDGILVGHSYLKRYFTYTGEFDPVNRAGESTTPNVPNSNLTGDIELAGLTKSRLIDRGDYFFLGDESYRLFLLYIAEPSVDLSGDWPSGEGRLLRLELFVPWTADKADGIPAGKYTMANRVQGGGIPRADIVPFRIVEGYPDVFEYNTGTWYQEFAADGSWVNYGRVTGGTVDVARNGDAHTITINLTDCSNQAHSITGVWTTDGPISIE